jgi:signal transduction histidine kinase
MSKSRPSASPAEVPPVEIAANGEGGHTLGQVAPQPESSLALLADLGDRLAQTLDPAAILDAVTDCVVPALAEYACAYQIEGAQVRLTAWSHREPAGERLLAELSRLYHVDLADPNSLIGEAYRAGEPRLLASVPRERLRRVLASQPDVIELIEQLDPCSVMVAPLHARYRTVGVLGLIRTSTGRPYTEADLELLAEVARRGALVLDNAALHRDVQQALAAAQAAGERTRRLQELTASLSRAHSFAAIAEAAVVVGARALGASAGVFYNRVGSGDTLEVVHSLGFAPDLVHAYQQVPLDAPLPICEAIRRREPIFLESPEAIHRFRSLDGQRLQATNGTWAALPILMEDDVVGGLGLAFRSARRFEPEDIELITAIARQTEQAIERARLYERAEEALQVRTKFLGTMSHELRTPLNAILGFSEMLDQELVGPLNEQQHWQVQRIHAGAEHLLMLINEVLALARLEARHESARQEPVELGSVVEAAARMIGPSATRKGLEFRLERPDAPIRLLADATKIKQILINLTSNAVKFTDRGSVAVRVRRESVWVRVEVEDTGCGVAEEFLEKIFEPFWQVQQSLTRNHDGAGLGLAVSREYARLMGGDLVVRSTLGQGCTFALLLPIREDSAQPPGQ